MIQDHAAGSILVEEAGGVVTDSYGRLLDFSKGKKLKANVGMVATSRGINAEVISAVREAVGV